MKTAVSIPDDVFRDAERLARRLKTSRSQLYSHALREYVDRHSADQITEALNKVYAEPSDETDAFVAEAARQTLDRETW